jgi:hypothetical protein
VLLHSCCDHVAHHFVLPVMTPSSSLLSVVPVLLAPSVLSLSPSSVCQLCASCCSSGVACRDSEQLLSVVPRIMPVLLLLCYQWPQVAPVIQCLVHSVVPVFLLRCFVIPSSSCRSCAASFPAASCLCYFIRDVMDQVAHWVLRAMTPSSCQS